MIKKALIVASVHPVLIEKLAACGYVCDIREQLTYEEAITVIPLYEGIITSNRLVIDAALMAAGKLLKWIGRMGSGMEIIDTAFAVQNGIACFNSPEGNAAAVAEQGLGMLLCLRHNILKAHLEIGDHRWLREENRGVEIEGQTAGIIGLGNNGAAFAVRLQAMGVQVLAYDKYENNYHLPGITGCASLEPIFEQADILSFHVPLYPDTRHYFNEDFLYRMKKPFTLLNLSRGPVVSLKAVYEGMQSGRVTAAALDVWEEEPYWNLPDALRAMAEALMRRPDFIGTPHIGGYTVQALYKMSGHLAQKICAYISC